LTSGALQTPEDPVRANNFELVALFFLSLCIWWVLQKPAAFRHLHCGNRRKSLKGSVLEPLYGRWCVGSKCGNSKTHVCKCLQQGETGPTRRDSLMWYGPSQIFNERNKKITSLSLQRVQFPETQLIPQIWKDKSGPQL